MPDVLQVSARLARSWDVPTPAAELAEFRHVWTGSDAEAVPRRSRPLPPAPGLGDLLPGALRCAKALGYTVTQRALPGPWAAVAGFTCREHAAIIVNPDRPGSASYGDGRLLVRAELALNLLHELAHAVDPVDHVFAHPGPPRPGERREALLAEAVACLAAEKLAARLGAGPAGGGQARYLASQLHPTEPLTIDEEAVVRKRADEAVRLVTLAHEAEPWYSSDGVHQADHALSISGHTVPLNCGAAAHGGEPPHAAAAAAAHWSRLRAAELAHGNTPVTG
jgi:hypothetical protein